MEKVMFNPERKNKFINETLQRRERSYAKGLFTQTSEYEKKIDLDVADFVKLSDFKKCLSNVHYLDSTSRFRYIKILIDYCEYNGNRVLDIYTKCGEKQELYDYMQDDARIVFQFDDICAIEDKINNMHSYNGWFYNACMYCAYYGFDIVKLKDFQYLLKGDIDTEKKVIKLSDDRDISYGDKPRLIKYLLDVVENDCQYNECNNGIVAYVGRYPDSVFKYGSKKNEFDEKKFVSQISRHFNQTITNACGEKISWKNIQDSGFCAYVDDKLVSEGRTLTMLLDREYTSEIKQIAFITTCQSEFSHTRNMENTINILKAYNKKNTKYGGS